MRRIDSLVVANIALSLLAAGWSCAAAAIDTVRVVTADYFQSYAGTFLDVTAKSDAARGSGVGSGAGTGSCVSDSGPCPVLTVTFSTDGVNFVSGASTTMTAQVDDGVYLRHALLIRLSNFAGNGSVVRPVLVRVTSSQGGTGVRAVDDFVDATASAPIGFQQDFFIRYQTPQDANAWLTQLAGERPDIAHLVALPFKTSGFRRHAQASIGCSVAGASAGNSALPGSPGATPAGFATPSSCASAGGVASQEARAIVLTSKAFGNDAGVEQGNLITARLTAPMAANAPLSVGVTGNAITVSLGTNAMALPSSTTNQVIAAINASPAASALVTADRFGTNAFGDSAIPQPTGVIPLSDFLWAPTSGTFAVARAPFQGLVLRICKFCDGSKPGVLLYAGEHGREWVTPLVALETAGRLVRNYGTDIQTTALVDNLDIFILPVVNPDGANYSLLNGGASQVRKNMAETCSRSGGSSSVDPSARNTWGVDIGSNFTVGSRADGFEGASAICTDDSYPGPSELSEPESRNLVSIVSNFPNIRFSTGVDSTGGNVLWPPGAYRAFDRQGLAHPSFGVNAWFRKAARSMLTAQKGYRGTVFQPARTGVLSDVQLPAAGNSIDELYYNYGVRALQLRCGADVFSTTSTTSNTGTAIGFQPAFASEGRAESLECASGLYGLLDLVRSTAADVTPPVVDAVPGTGMSSGPVAVHFTASEPADIYYTTDGSTPTIASPRYAVAGLDEHDGEVLTFTQTTTLKWFGVDTKGNASTVHSATYTIAFVPPDLTVTTAHVGDFTQGQVGAKYYVTVLNVGMGDKLAGDQVVMADLAPAGITITAMSGSGWNCVMIPTCVRSDALPAGQPYPLITVTVTVASDATSPQVNGVQVSTSAPESTTANNTVYDPTIVVAPGASLLTVIKAGSGSGTVISQDGGINCGATCDHGYGDGSTVTLAPSPDGSSFFTGWLGPCTGTGYCVVTVNGAASVLATFALGANVGPNILDIDADGQYDAQTDGLMMLRYLFGLTGAAASAGAMGPLGNRTDSVQVGTYLDDIRPYLDADGNGTVDALTDGLLIIRELLGLSGSALVQDAIGPNATRATAELVHAYLSTLKP